MGQTIVHCELQFRKINGNFNNSNLPETKIENSAKWRKFDQPRSTCMPELSFNTSDAESRCCLNVLMLYRIAYGCDANDFRESERRE